MTCRFSSLRPTAHFGVVEEAAVNVAGAAAVVSAVAVRSDAGWIPGDAACEAEPVT